MPQFKVAIATQDYYFEIHSATCPDPARKYRKGEVTEPRMVSAETGDAALAAALADIFGSGQDRGGVDRDDCSFADVGFAGRVFPCCKKNPS